MRARGRGGGIGLISRFAQVRDGSIFLIPESELSVSLVGLKNVEMQSRSCLVGFLALGAAITARACGVLDVCNSVPMKICRLVQV